MSNYLLIHPLLLPEILEQVFFFLAISDDQTYDENIDDLFSCALVCRQWCRNSVPIIWEKPFETYYRKCTKVVSSLVLFLENINPKITKHQQQSNYIIHEYLNSKYQQDYIKTIAFHNNSINSSPHNNSIDSSPHNNSINSSPHNNSINSSIHTSSNSLPLFNYPSFIKHLNYDRLYNSIDRWCKMEGYIPDTMEVYVMRALLRLMADSGGILTTLKIHPKHSSEFRYCLIHEPEICGLFEKVKYLTHDGCCYVDYTMPLALSTICKDVKHLCLYGWNAQNFRDQSHRSGSDLTQFISQQSTLYSLNLKRCHRFTPYVLSGLSSQIKFLKYLHFEYVDFEGCDAWNDIAECKNLEVFKIAFCCNIYWEMAKPVIKEKFRKLRKVVVWEVDCKELIEWANKFNNNELGRTIKWKRSIC